MSRRATGTYVKEQVRDAVTERKDEMVRNAKEAFMRTTSNPNGMGMVGALVGGAFGMFLARKLVRAGEVTNGTARGAPVRGSGSPGRSVTKATRTAVRPGR